MQRMSADSLSLCPDDEVWVALPDGYDYHVVAAGFQSCERRFRDAQAANMAGWCCVVCAIAKEHTDRRSSVNLHKGLCPWLWIWRFGSPKTHFIDRPFLWERFGDCAWSTTLARLLPTSRDGLVGRLSGGQQALPSLFIQVMNKTHLSGVDDTNLFLCAARL